MAELLKDDMEEESTQDHMGQTPCRREVLDLMSWLQFFSSYTAVVCSKYLEKAREMWAY